MAAESTKSPEVEHDDNWVLLAHSQAPPGLEEAIASVQDKISVDTTRNKVREVTYVFVEYVCCFVAYPHPFFRIVYIHSPVSTGVNHAILPFAPSHLHTFTPHEYIIAEEEAAAKAHCRHTGGWY